MNYHHASEMIELNDDSFVMINYPSWETDTITGKDTEYTQEVKLTTPNKYNEQLYDHLTEKGYNVNFGTDIWVTGSDRQLTVILKTKQAKKRETLTDSISNDTYLYFENARLL